MEDIHQHLHFRQLVPNNLPQYQVFQGKSESAIRMALALLAKKSNEFTHILGHLVGMC